MARSIPDRWKSYKPVGRKVEGTRFIAFKVPLKEHISNTVASDVRLDDTILLKSIPNLGLIIDLTNTKRYYDPETFTKMGVEYEKLMVPGHDTPQEYLVKKFKRLVKEYLRNNPDNDKLVGVHCTHGVNRTGYFICNYMISEMAIDPKEAIRRFDKARGHKIERINYIDDLLKGKPRGLTDKREISAKLNNWREKYKYKAFTRERYDNSIRSNGYRRRSTSPKTYRRDSYNRTRAPQRSQNSRYDNKFHYRSGENANNQQLSEPREEVCNRRPALRTDYYSTRPATSRERSTHFKRR